MSGARGPAGGHGGRGGAGRSGEAVAHEDEAAARTGRWSGRAGGFARPAGRGSRLLAGAAAVLLAVGACGLPRSGPVQQGDDMGPAALPPVRVAFSGPARGATPEQIVRGFLVAGWSSQDDYRSARSYLTAAAAQAWDPKDAVTVYETSSDLRVAVIGAYRLRLTVAESAHLDADGRYAARPVGSRRTSVVSLTRTDGEWRISALEPGFGVWLPRAYFESAYRPFDVAYTSASASVVVGDRRWFAVGTPLPTTLARVLLRSVPAYLGASVTNGFPSGTTLVVDAVPVVGGTAQVDLSTTMLKASPDARRHAWAQALATLTQLPDVAQVQLRVDERNLDIGAIPGTPTSASALGFEVSEPYPTRLVRRIGADASAVDVRAVFSGDPTGAVLAGHPLGRVAADAGRLAASRDLGELAALGPGGDLRRWRAGTALAPLRLGSSLTGPAYDRLDHLWVGGVDAAGRGRLWTTAARGEPAEKPTAIAAPWLAGRRILQVVPAPDGARVLLVTRNAAGELELDVTGVTRDGRGRPVSLAEPWRVGGDVVDALDATWVDENTLGVIGRRTAANPYRPLLVSPGGPTVELARVSDPRRILTTGGSRGMVVLSGSGQAYSRVGGAWAAFGHYDDLAVPPP